MHKLLQYFQSLYSNEGVHELKGVHIANFEVDVCSSGVEYCSISLLIVTNVPVNSAAL